MQAELSLRRATEPASRCEELHSWGAGGPLLSICASGTPSNQDVRAFLPQPRADLSGEWEGDRTSISSLGVMDGDVCRRVVLFVAVFIPETSRPLL